MKQDEIGVITAVLDGYSAPLTAGNFVDIAQSGYYDHTRVLSSSRNFFVQLGEKEDDDEEGYIGKRGTKRREIPLEILVRGERVPNYGATLDEFGIADMGVVLPVSGFGALAMVHSVENANDASCQFYIFTGRGRESVLTGSLGTFGYVVKGGAVLGEIEAGDEIVSVRIVSGADGLVLGEK